MHESRHICMRRVRVDESCHICMSHVHLRPPPPHIHTYTCTRTQGLWKLQNRPRKQWLRCSLARGRPDHRRHTDRQVHLLLEATKQFTRRWSAGVFRRWIWYTHIFPIWCNTYVWPHAYVTWLIHMWHDSSHPYVTWLIWCNTYVWCHVTIHIRVLRTWKTRVCANISKMNMVQPLPDTMRLEMVIRMQDKVLKWSKLMFLFKWAPEKRPVKIIHNFILHSDRPFWISSFREWAVHIQILPKRWYDANAHISTSVKHAETLDLARFELIELPAKFPDYFSCSLKRNTKSTHVLVTCNGSVCSPGEKTRNACQKGHRNRKRKSSRSLFTWNVWKET